MRIFRAAAMAAALLNCARPAQVAKTEAVDVGVVQVRVAPVIAFHQVAGTVRSETASTLSANVVGTVVRVNVAEGDRVRRGDVLVEIDARDLRANADRARAGGEEIERAIDAARANAQLASVTFQRYDSLLRENTSLPINVDEEPLTCVVRGTGRILDDPVKYRGVLTLSRH